MDAIRTKKLVQQFPLFLRGRNHSIRENLMAFGCECGPGWYGILQEAFAVAESECRARLKRGAKLEDLPIAVQVKEKFGTLRLYAHNCSDHVYAAIEKAEAKSATVCEQCGKPSKVGGQGWLSTRCDACKEANTREQEREQAQRKETDARLAELAATLAECYYNPAAHLLSKQERAKALHAIFGGYASAPQKTVTEAMVAHRPVEGAREARAVMRTLRKKGKSTYYLKKLLKTLKTASV